MKVPASPSHRRIVTLGLRWRWLSCPEHQLHIASGLQSQEQVWATCLVSPGARKSSLETRTTNKSRGRRLLAVSAWVRGRAPRRGKNQFPLFKHPLPACVWEHFISRIYFHQSLSRSQNPRVLTNMLSKVCTGVSWDQEGMPEDLSRWLIFPYIPHPQNCLIQLLWRGSSSKKYTCHWCSAFLSY